LKVARTDKKRKRKEKKEE